MSKAKIICEKLIIITAILVICISGFAYVASAQNNRETTQDRGSQEGEVTRGRVISVDREKNEIAVRMAVTQEVKVINVKAKIPPNVNVGRHARIKLKEGSNEAEYVKKIRHSGE